MLEPAIFFTVGAFIILFLDTFFDNITVLTFLMSHHCIFALKFVLTNKAFNIENARIIIFSMLPQALITGKNTFSVLFHFCKMQLVLGASFPYVA